MPSVLQKWVEELPYMQQAVLLSAVRGPDGTLKESSAKPLVRALRRMVLVSAYDGSTLNLFQSGGGDFMGPVTHPEGLTGVFRDFLKGWDSYNLHFLLHITHAIEIIGYKHPDDIVKQIWHNLYVAIVIECHMNTETEEQLDRRLKW